MTIATYKEKCASRQCGKHMGFLEHGMKIFEMVQDRRLRKLVIFYDSRFGFMPGKSCSDFILAIRRL